MSAAADPAVGAAVCIIEHAVSLADAETLLEMLGLDAPFDWSCPDCAEPVTSLAHALACVPAQTAERISVLAEAIGARS